MNFFEHQQRARQRTGLLVFLFMVAAAATVVLANLVVFAVVNVFAFDDGVALSLRQSIRAHPQAFLWTSLATITFIGGATLYRMLALSAGGRAVARALGATLVDGESKDPLQRQFTNVVEEMAIAAGIPMPQLYVLEQETGINAFAAGYSSSDAAIVVTRGTLELLTRDELQGVVAHEFSHILNGDMRLNTRLLGILFGILVIGLVGRMILRGVSHTRTSSRRSGNAIGAAFAIALALIVIGYIGLLFGKMIRAAVSRQREFLADASAVQFTRNPAGIAGALKKIAASPLRTVLQSVDGDEISHMLIADGRKAFQSLFATHPPVLERIKAIDRHFSPAELDRISLTPVSPAAQTPVKPKPTIAQIMPALVIASVGSPGEAQLEIAARRTAELPEPLRRAAHSRVYAPGLIVALVLSRDPSERARQLARLQQRLPAALVAHLTAIATMASTLDPVYRLPLAEISFPALRQRTPDELQSLVGAIDEVARMDGRFDVLDYALVRLLRVQLMEAAKPQASLPRAIKLHSVRDDVRVLFSVVARVGQEDKYLARVAYEQGMQSLLGSPVPTYAPPEPWMGPLDRALTRLDALLPADKQRLVEALVVTISHDRQVTLGEVELLRAVCASVHCPLPPLMVSGATSVSAALQTKSAG